MGYLKCDKCGGHYELQQGEKPSDFSDTCQCGGKLQYVENLEDNKPKPPIKQGKKKGHKPYGGIAVLVCIVGFVIICIIGAFFPNGAGANGNLTYSGQGITFQYPNNWNISDTGTIHMPDGMGSVMEWSLADYVAGPPAIPATLDPVASNIRSGVEGPADKQQITVAGVPAIEYIPQQSGSKERADLVFIKGDNLYDVFVASDHFDEDKDGFNMIIKTLQFTS